MFGRFYSALTIAPRPLTGQLSKAGGLDRRFVEHLTLALTSAAAPGRSSATHRSQSWASLMQARRAGREEFAPSAPWS